MFLVQGCNVSLVVTNPVNLQAWIQWIIARGGVPKVVRYDDVCEGLDSDLHVL
jgi:hypothetical protein